MQSQMKSLDILSSEPNGWHFAGSISKCIFWKIFIIFLLNLNRNWKLQKQLCGKNSPGPSTTVVNKSTFGTCSNPLAGLDQYTRTTLNAVSWVDMMTKWLWRSRSMTPIFNTSWENPKIKFGANLVILAQIHYKLSRRKAKFPRIWSQNGQNDLEGPSQWPPFSIPAESIPGCMFVANLVILAQICDKL